MTLYVYTVPDFNLIDQKSKKTQKFIESEAEILF